MAAKALPRVRQNDSGTQTPVIQFTINTGENNDSRLTGSVQIVSFVDSSGNTTLLGTTGNYDSTTAVVTASASPDLLAGLGNNIASITISSVNFIDHLYMVGARLYAAPSKWALNGSSGWSSYSNCPTGNTLVVVHGMLSYVEGTGGAFPIPTIQVIASANGSYDSVVGFDYNWTQAIDTSGAQLASFLDELAVCPGVHIDIEAHSEGVPVSMSAITQTTTASSIIRRLICLGGPIMGTPAAGDARILAAWVVGSSSMYLPAGLQIQSLADLLQLPFASGLAVSKPGDGGILDVIRSRLANLSLSSIQIIVVAGNTSSAAAILMGPSDGIIPITSALAFQSGLKVYPLLPFAGVGHTELTWNSFVIQQVGQQVTDPQKPSLEFVSPSNCTGPLNCSAAAGTTFVFGGADYYLNGPIYGYELVSTGNITPFHQLQASGSGAITAGSTDWQDATSCSDSASVKMFFAVDHTTNYSSNAVTEQELVGSCPTTNPAPSIVSLSPGSLSAGVAPQVLTINGSGFLSSSTVTFNGGAHTPTFVSGSQITISLTSVDLATTGTFPVVVTNPTPGGGPSNTVYFTVITPPIGSVTISPTSATVPEGAIKVFTATITGGGNVVWSMQEGVAGGTVVGGLYTAPNTTGTFHVVATNALDSSKTATATVTVVLPEQSLMRLTNDTATDNSPAWSPQGNSIAFASTSGHSVAGIYDLWAIGPDGSNLRQLTSVPDVAFSFGVGNPAWIGSSGNLYILDTPSLWYWYLFPLSTTGSLPVDPTTLTAVMSVPGGLGSSWLAVSPDGVSAAWDTTTTMNATCPSSTQLRLAPTSSLTGQATTVAGNLIATGTLNCGTYGGESIMGASFSPDGSQIVISRTPDPNYYGFDLEIYTTGGTLVRKLTNNGGGPIPVSNRAPNWSSDNRIAFASNSTGRSEIYTINPDGSNLTQVTSNGGTSPSWSPDASKIAFASDRTGNSQVYTIPAPH
jgi:hypothetical protein